MPHVRTGRMIGIIAKVPTLAQKDLPMAASHSEALIFTAKAAIASVSAALCYEYFTLPGNAWVATVSAVIVSQPDLHSSLKNSLLRVLANLAGAFGGAALLVLIDRPIIAMGVGVVLTGLICHLIKQDDALKPAFVAVILVTLFGEHSKWQNSMDRVTAVIIGCACALIVGFLFDKISGLGRPGAAAKSGDRPAE